MSTSPVNAASTAALSGTSSVSQTNSTQQASIDALGNPDTFLQLLVAQLKYQDPENPADGTAFVTQLATFAGVQEQASMRSDLDSINSVAQQWAAGQAAQATGAASSGAADAGTADSTGASSSNPATTSGTPNS